MDCHCNECAQYLCAPSDSSLLVSTDDQQSPSTPSVKVPASPQLVSHAPTPVAVDPFAADPAFPWRWWNAVVPFVVMLAVTLTSVFVIGLFRARELGFANPSMSEMLSKSRAVEALLWGMLTSTALVFIMLLAQGRKLLALVDEWGEGCKVSRHSETLCFVD